MILKECFELVFEVNINKTYELINIKTNMKTVIV